MKLVPKLTLTVLAGVFAVLALFTAWRVHGEIDAFDRDMRRDHRMIGLTAAAALSKTRTRDDAIKLVRRVDASREKIELRFVSFSSQAGPDLLPAVGAGALDPPHPAAVVQVEKRLGEGSAATDHLLTYIGAPVVNDEGGAIELVQSLAPRATYVWRGIWSVLAAVITMLLVCGVIILTVGARMVGAPVSELVRAARRIGAGDFDVLGHVRRKDEFGELARELRSMGMDLEAARKRMKDDTEARIQALEQLRHAERLATLGQLASVLAHEIGTPLNVIAGHAKMIATGKLAGEGAQTSALAIGSQCDRMTQIVRRILDYARRRPPRRAWIDAADVMQQTCELLSGLAEQRQIELRFDSDGKSYPLLADPYQLQQVLTNVVMNAIQASATGSRVRLRVDTRTIDDGAERPFVVLSVEDQGQGIPVDLRERIFEPFFTTKPAGDGTGLGLSVVRDIVQEHGGFVDLSSQEGEGSLFQLYLPEGAGDASSSARR